ncbi:MAG TPA: BTAD domain-containing putative transcriptional regulator [Egibacteraceae bacterium]|nr:BTAD domain-containing putative transcriptional regulator [Egibacteraceae bacterium]
MGWVVRLLGTPRLEHEGVEVAGPRGNKAWALLAYLVLSDGPVRRDRIAALLFPDVADPAGAVRWNLSQLRKAIAGLQLDDDPLRLSIPDDVAVDVGRLIDGDMPAAEVTTGELLAGMRFDGAPAFELWVSSERRRVQGMATALLREAALDALNGRPSTAAVFAERVVVSDPYDENAHVLLVRCLRAAGRVSEAEAQVATSTELLRRELGTEPSAALRRAAQLPAAGEATSAGRAAVQAQLQAGEAAVSAGATDAGVDALRRAVLGARGSGDRQLLVRSLVALGGALIHAARGSDQDALPALHEAASVAHEIGARSLLGTAQREIGWVNLLRGRYERGRVWLDRARDTAPGDVASCAWVDAAAGALETDVADYETAFARLDSAIAAADAANEPRAWAFASAMRGRAHLLRRELEAAVEHSAAAIDRAQATGWTSFVPFPSSIIAEAHLLGGDVATAGDMFDHAFALGCQIQDPCWESLAARGMGLVAAERGDTSRAFELLADAPQRCARLPDSYLWVQAYALDALAQLAVRDGHPRAEQWVDELDRLASSHGMRELRVSVARHWAALGEEGAAETAVALAKSIDNPALLTRT